MSLGDRGSFDVSEYLGLHPDIFEIPGRGAFINNNPGASILGAIPYAVFRPAIDRLVERVRLQRAALPEDNRTYNSVYPLAREFYQKARARGLDVKFGLAAGVMQAFLMAPLSAVSAVVMFVVLSHLAGSPRWALALSLLYAFATPVFYRTAQMNQNLLLGHFSFFAFFLLWKPWDKALRPSWMSFFLAGLLSGWTVVLDYSGIIPFTLLGAYALHRASPRLPGLNSIPVLLSFSCGAFLSLSVLLFYQWSCFGSPLHPAQHFMPATEYTGYGYRGIDWPHLDLLRETAFGMRYGLFTSAPLLLLSFFAPVWLRHRFPRLGTRELGFIILFTAGSFIFCAMNQYGRLQFNTGVRYIVPVTPFLFLLTANVLFRMPIRWAAAAGVIGTFWSWSLAMYRDVEQGSGVIEAPLHVATEGFRFPWLQTIEKMGYVPAGVWEIPLLGFAGFLVFLVWRGNTWIRNFPKYGD